MATTYLVDGYNALWKLVPALPTDREVARRLLVRAARAALGSLAGGGRAHLVFDTLPGSSLRGGSGRDGPVSWEYAPGSADEAICAWIRHHGGEDVVVVTDDRELRGRARQLGARGSPVRDVLGPPAPGGPPARRDPPGRVAGPRPSAADFGLPSGPIDLTGTDPETL